MKHMRALLHRLQEVVDPAVAQQIATLQPDTVIPVFHGTDYTTAIKFAEVGIDGRARTNRLYPHYIRTQVGGPGFMVNRGVFVAPDFDTASSFGSVVVEFSARGKDLWYRFPSPTETRNADKTFRTQYPQSFRPAVSYDLLWTGTEPQALFRGTLGPEKIIAVYTTDYDAEGTYEQPRYHQYRAKFTREQFIQWFYAVFEKPSTQGSTYNNYNRAGHNTHFVGPDEVVTPEEFIRRVMARFKKLDKDYLLGLIKDRLTESESYQGQIRAFMSVTGSSNMSYSAAKRLMPALLRYLNVPKAPNVPDEPEQYHGV